MGFFSAGLQCVLGFGVGLGTAVFLRSGFRGRFRKDLQDLEWHQGLTQRTQYP